MGASVMTVRGPVDAAEIGFTLPHEHVLVDLVRIHPANMLAFDFQLLDEELAIEAAPRSWSSPSMNVSVASQRPWRASRTISTCT